MKENILIKIFITLVCLCYFYMLAELNIIIFIFYLFTGLTIIFLTKNGRFWHDKKISGIDFFNAFIVGLLILPIHYFVSAVVNYRKE